MKFEYYYGSQADQFSFIKIPKAMLTEEVYSTLSLQAKMLYGVLLDRMNLSMKNGWFDAENKVFIICQITEIQDYLGFSKKKAIDYLNELEEFGLVEKKRRGLGLPSILYVKSFLVQKDCSVKNASTELSVFRSNNLGTSRVVDFDTSRSVDLETSRSSEIALQEVSKSVPLINNTKENNTKGSNHQSNQDDPVIGISEEKVVPEEIESVRDVYEKIIKENIEYDYLIQAEWIKKEEIDELVTLMVDTVSYECKKMRIGGRDIPYQEVKSRFLKLTRSHIEYVLEALEANCTNIKDTYRYNLTALFNAPTTISNYYRALVKHDMYGAEA